MALISPFSTCAICNGALDRPYTATSGLPLLFDARLAQYYDAPLHFDCLSQWTYREEFSAGYFVSKLASRWRGDGGTLLAVTVNWLLVCGPASADEDPYYAAVQLAEWPFTLYSTWGEWDAYVAGGFRGSMAGPPLEAACDVMAQVRNVAPSLDALRALRAKRFVATRGPRSLTAFGDYLATLWGERAYRWDWEALEEERRAQIRENARAARRRAEAIARSNESARRLAAELANWGHLGCPHCRRRTTDMRFIDRGPEAASYFICGACGGSFSGSEAAE